MGHTTDRRLGALAVELGLIDSAQLTVVLAAGEDDSTLPGRLVERGWLSPAQATQLLTLAGQGHASGATVLDPSAAASPGSPAAEGLASAPARIDQRPGCYEGAAEIARGGMGAILVARDPQPGREVAIKVMHGDLSPADIESFLAEAQVTAQLQHPNIVPVHAVSATPAGEPFFTMQRVRGKSLAEVLDGCRDGGDAWTLNRLLRVFAKICDGVGFAHSRGVIHRDLKPDNVMVGEFGEVLVMDWGLAKLVGPAETAARTTETVTVDLASTTVRRAGMPTPTLAGTIMGTPAYMAPEQARGDIARIDRHTDIYALGAMLYELLTHSPPYDGPDIGSVLACVAVGGFDRPSVRRPAARIPHELEAIVLKAMALRPEDRYARVAELQADLEAYLEGGLVGVARYSLSERALKWIRRHRVAAAMLATAALAAVGVGGQHGLAVRRREQARRREITARRAAIERAAPSALIRSTDAMVADAPADVRSKRAAPGPELQRRYSAQLQRLWRTAEVCGALLTLTDDAGARRARFDLLLAASRLAALSADYAVADMALDAVGSDPPDAAALAAARAHLEGLRSLQRRTRRAEIGRLLTAARRGQLAHETELRQAVVQLASYPERQTVERLVGALDIVSARLAAVSRQTLLATVTPTADERLAGSEPIEGLPAAVDAWAAAFTAPGPPRSPSRAQQTVLEAAFRRLEERDWRRRGRLLHAPRRWRAILAGAQDAAFTGVDLGPLLDLISGALGQLRDPQASVPALVRYLWADWNASRSIPAGIALGRLAALDPRAGEALIAFGGLTRTRLKWDAGGRWWRRVGPGLRAHDGGLQGADPDDGTGWAVRARLLRLRGQTAAAAQAARRAVRLEPADPGLWRLLGAVLRDGGDLRGALEAVEEALRRGPGDPQTLVARAGLALRLGQAKAALADADAALAREPGHVDARVLRGRALSIQGRQGEALEALDRALALAPEHPGALVERGVVYLELGRYADGIRDCTQALGHDPNRIQAYLSRGAARSRIGDQAGAIADFDRVLSKRPDDAATLGYRAVARVLAGDLTGARADAEAAIARAPRQARAHLARGMVNQTEGDPEAAVADYDRALRLDPSLEPARLHRAAMRRAAGRLDAALADITEALRQRPGSGAAYYERANVRRDQGRLDEALADYGRAIELDPRRPDAHVNRGLVRHDQGDSDGAASDFDAALRLEPRHFLALVNRGRLRLALGRRAEAITDFSQALSINPSLASAYSWRGMARFGGAERALALADFARAMQLAPTDASHPFNRGTAYLRLREYRRALPDFDRALRLDPRHAGAFANRGISRLALGQLPGAIADLGRAIALGDTDPLVRHTRGDAYLRSGRPAEAIADFDRALTLDPRRADSLVLRGQAHGMRRDYPRAIADFAAAIALRPRSASAHYNRGYARELAGDPAAALPDYTRAIALQPDLLMARVARCRARWRVGRLEGALADGREATRRAPRDWSAWYELGRALAASKDVAGAREALATAQRLAPGHARGRVRRALQRLGG